MATAGVLAEADFQREMSGRVEIRKLNLLCTQTHTLKSVLPHF
jgi:hypothetical protein